MRRRAASDDNLNETLQRVFKNIEASAKGTASEDDLKGLFDDIDVNSNKLGSTVPKRNERLVKLLNGVGDIDRILPPISRFGDDCGRTEKKRTVIEKLVSFFEKYFGIVSDSQ